MLTYDPNNFLKWELETNVNGQELSLLLHIIIIIIIIITHKLAETVGQTGRITEQSAHTDH